jgi:predicted porin
MKKSLIALAALAAAGVASAQSSVTIWGIVDAGISHYSNKGSGGFSKSRTAMTNGNNASSQLGFRGTEDLGGGLAANFWLEASLSNDDGRAGQGINWPGGGRVGGTTSSNGATDFFNRQSWVGLSGGFGAIRLGRDYTPTFLVDSVFDPFGTVGVGTNLLTKAGGVFNTDIYVRSSNAISYFLPPNLGGFYGQLMYGLGESDKASGAGSVSTGNFIGGRIGWSNGPLNVMAAYSEADISDQDGTVVAHASPTFAALSGFNAKVKTANIGASYDFGVAKLMGEYGQNKLSTTNLFTLPTKNNGWMLGVTAPLGAGVLKASYSAVKYDGSMSPLTTSDAKSSQWALGYVYNLSKRTALYATVARISNDNGAPSVVGGPAFSNTVGDTSTGYDFGLRHSF